MKRKVVWVVSIIVIIISVVVIGGYLYRNNYIKPLSDKIVGGDGTVHTINTDCKLINMSSVCDSNSEFSIITEYVQVTGAGEEGGDFYWEVPTSAEVVSVDSNRGKIESEVLDEGILVTLEGGGDTQLVIYMKSYDLEKSLTEILKLNQSVEVVYGFNYVVVLPDTSTVGFGTYTGEGNIILNKYFEDAIATKEGK